MSRSFLTVFLLACAGATDTSTVPADTDEPGVQCGDPVVYDIEIVAAAQHGKAPAAAIEIALDDRGYTGDILGSGTTSADGKVTFTAVGVTALDGCWGTLLNYVLVGTDPADGTEVEDDMNAELYNAIDDGSLVADVTAFPLTF